MGIKIEVDYETVDLIMEEGLKNSLDTNAGVLIRLIRELTEDNDAYQFEDLHESLLIYADIYRTIQYYFVHPEAEEIAMHTLRKNLGET